MPASFSDLAARLVTTVPAGFSQQPDTVGDTGPSDLAKAIRDDGTPQAATALRSEGFVRGYQRLWANAQQAQIIVFVYQFATSTGASQDFARRKPLLRSQAPPSAHAFNAPGLPTSRSAGMSESAGGDSAAVVLFTTGVYNAQVVCNGPNAVGLEACVASIADTQYRRLRTT